MFDELTSELLDLQVEQKGLNRATFAVVLALCCSTTCCCCNKDD